jgi:Dullard-like phosphatase family protein
MLRQPSVAIVSRLPLALFEYNVTRTVVAAASSASRSYCHTAVAERGWIPPEQRVSRRSVPAVRVRRPLVNGSTVAFHVNDLVSNSPSENVNSINSSNNNGIHVDIRSRSNNPRRQTHTSNGPKQYNSDMIVVLDMDECLIHSKFLSNEQDAQLYAYQLRQQAQHNEPAESGFVSDSFRVCLHDGTLVHVHVRPGLYEFLKLVCSRYETHIYTAATSIYADAVLDHLEAKINENSVTNDTGFAGRWYRQHCTFDSSRRAYVKDLNNLWPRIQYQQNRPVNDKSLLSRAVLVDNNPLSFLSNPENGILVSSFFTDGQDSALPEVWNVLQQLEDKHDVRPTLTEKYDLKTMLNVQYDHVSALA